MVAPKVLLSEKALSAMEKSALLNATRHNGKAEVGAVVGRILGDFPELRSRAGAVAAAAKKVVESVNGMSLQRQESTLREKYPDAAKATQKEGRVGLPPLPNAVKGKTAFRLPPEPSGFMTIGHAMAFTINYLYKETYDGELWLRFEDTNPRKVAPKYYDSFRDGTRWLGIEWDHEKNVSDDIELMYDKGTQLIEEGKAYACSCDLEKVKRLRAEGTACEHRGNSVEKNLLVWEELLAKRHKEGEFVIRLKGDMRNLNYSLRDPNIFRVIDKPHPLTGTKYNLWPTYDVANAVEDEICGITHVLRSSEFRNELQQVIREALRLRHLEVIQFSRFNFKGTPVQKRLLRPLVENRMVSGWDDPRMPTVEGQKRRGIIPQAIRDFTLQVGYTKTEHEYDWSILLSVNRKLLDPVSRRYFFVPDPVELKVQGAPKLSAKIPYHPENDLGDRTIETSGRFLVPKSDIGEMKKGSKFRLIDLFNVELLATKPKPVAKYVGDELVREMHKLQWVVPNGSKTKVVEPGLLFDDNGEFNNKSITTVEGVAESSFASVETGTIVQFPRFGFVRLDTPGMCILAHR